MLTSQTLFILFLCTLGTILFKYGLFLVRQQECMIVERLGRFHKVIDSGLHIIIPFIDQPRKILWVQNSVIRPVQYIDMREALLEIPEQHVITRDNVGISIDALIYIQVVEVKKSAYEIQSVPLAVGQLTQTTLRSLAGEMDLDQTLSGRDTINSRLRIVLDEATHKWGVQVSRVEIKNILPPPEVQQAMEKQMQAERERRAKVLTAEGEKQSQILEAEGNKISLVERSQGERESKINQALGDKEAAIARAQGEAESITTVAQAQAHAIKEVTQACGQPGLGMHYLVSIEYLKTLAQMGQKQSDKIFIPYEASGALSGIGALSSLLKPPLSQPPHKNG